MVLWLEVGGACWWKLSVGEFFCIMVGSCVWVLGGDLLRIHLRAGFSSGDYLEYVLWRFMEGVLLRELARVWWMVWYL